MTIRVAIRTTARIPFVLFLGAFLGNALYRLVPAPATHWLIAKKHGLTLGFAGSHTGASCVYSYPIIMAALGREHIGLIVHVPRTDSTPRRSLD